MPALCHSRMLFVRAYPHETQEMVFDAHARAFALFKPGALRNGAPFKDWVLPAAMERVRRKLTGVDDGNRQMVDILNAVLIDGLPAVEAACAEAISPTASILPMSFSTYWPASVILRRQPT